MLTFTSSWWLKLVISKLKTMHWFFISVLSILTSLTTRRIVPPFLKTSDRWSLTQTGKVVYPGPLDKVGIPWEGDGIFLESLKAGQSKITPWSRCLPQQRASQRPGPPRLRSSADARRFLARFHRVPRAEGPTARGRRSSALNQVTVAGERGSSSRRKATAVGTRSLDPHLLLLINR